MSPLPPRPVPADFPEFRVKSRFYYHIGYGWSLCRILPFPGTALAWRVYWGHLGEGNRRPTTFSNYFEGNRQVEFPQFHQAVAWVLARAKVGPSDE